MMPPLKPLLAVLALALSAASLRAGDFPGVDALAARRVPWMRHAVSFARLPAGGSTAGRFELRTRDGRLEVRATDASAAAMGLGWYLKYYCHRSMSHVGDNLSPVDALPALAEPVVIDATAAYRYALNYCTYNYTMAFYSWQDWEHELDWMAISGVNLMLVANGEEAVWQRTLRRLGYAQDEIAAFIPGPGYTAWWLMGNLEGAGGPMSASMIDRRAAVQSRMLGRMRELGIQPLMPGFYGMVPASLGGKLKAHIIDQGRWASYHRPSILDPTDPQFARVADIYYGEMKALYGSDLHFFSGDPFHEGGVTEGVDLAKAGGAIQAAMQRAFPGSTWVLQGWIDNPKKALISETDRSHVLVQELMGEATHNWELRRGYEGTPFIWCCINNFGERPGVFGALQRYADETYRARTGPYGTYLKGVGIMPEGIANNPVAYDLALELGWHADHVDVAQWIHGYVQYRYGRADPDVDAAWSILLKTVYTEANGNGPENVLCSRPSLPVRSASAWGSLKIGYDPALFEHAVDLFVRAGDRLRGSETYALDRIALELQLDANRANAAALGLGAALQSRDRAAFDAKAKDLLGLGAGSNLILDADPFYRLETYRSQALRYGATQQEKANCLRNALSLITFWGGDDRTSDDLHDYAFKAWAGMMTSYDLGRWQAYIETTQRNWDHPQSPGPDFFAWERDWVSRNAAWPAP